MTVRVVLLMVVAVGVWQAFAADPPPASPRVEFASDSSVISTCAGCHEGDWKAKYPNSAPFFLGNEFTSWIATDPHIRAYEVLKTKRSQDMVKPLKLTTDAKSGMITDARCLSCHAVDTTQLPEKMRGDVHFIAGDNVGVGCVLCHSEANSREWILDHANAGTWRKKTAAQKSSDGMRDLRNPLVKAALCASCHVGNEGEGKVVTHAMYAAGHPPLPPLELMGFVEHQPKHFKLPSEITEKPIHTQSYGDYRADHVAIGALVALKAEAEMLAAEAKKALPNGMIDWARFDCYACHHTLTNDTSRQERDFTKRSPGRPPLKAWNAALADTISKFVGDTEFAKVYPPLEAAIFDKPFGKPDDVAKAAEAVAKWAGELAKSPVFVEKFKDPKQVAAFREALKTAMLSPAYSADAEAVMALLWAYRTVGGDAKWDEVDRKLPSQLRVLKSSDGKPVTAFDEFKRRQSVFNNYHRDEFQKLFK